MIKIDWYIWKNKIIEINKEYRSKVKYKTWYDDMYNYGFTYVEYYNNKQVIRWYNEDYE